MESYPGAVVDVKYDEKGTLASQMIEYDIVMAIQTDAEIKSILYIPPYYQYSNIEYYLMTNKETVWHTTEIVGYGNEIGDMTITEDFDVRRVEVMGSGCHGPAWIECNGTRRDWVYTHDAQYPTNDMPQGTEKLTWILDNPTNIINFVTVSIGPFLR